MEVNKHLEEINEIELEQVKGSTYCQFSVIENDLARIYRNQEKILQAIKLLSLINSHTSSNHLT
jgi:hypothetical protein